LYDDEFFRIKNIPDTDEARQIITGRGLVLTDSIESVKLQARSSLAQRAVHFFVSSWGYSGTGDGEMIEPADLSVDTSTNMS
jgi:hypothetical protein